MEAKMKMRYDVKGLRCGAVFTTSFSFITSTSLTSMKHAILALFSYLMQRYTDS